MPDGHRILFKLVEPMAVTLPGDAAALATAVQTQLSQVLNGLGLPNPDPLLADLDRDAVQEAVDEARTDNPGREAEVPNPLLCFAVDVDPNGSLSPERLAELLRDLPSVEWAQVEGIVDGAVNAIDNPAAVLQTYLNPTPVGIGANSAWAQPGGDGTGVTVGVVEPYHFDVQHRDLPGALIVLTTAPSSVVVSALDHATGVLGIVAAADNTDDCVGIAPASAVVFAGGQDPGLQIREGELFLLQHRVGLFQLGRGDVLNLSIATRDNASTGGFPLDFRPSHRTATRLLSFRGTTVIEGVGNGIRNAAPCQGIDLDTAVPGDLVPSDSPAIVVGGAQPAGPPGTFTRYACSNFGARVDCCALASGVLTLAATITDASGAPTHTVAAQEGTSFATAIISGAVAAMQGIRKARGNPPLTPAQVKAILKDPVLTSNPCPGQRVGRMPNLSAIVPQL